MKTANTNVRPLMLCVAARVWEPATTTGNQSGAGTPYAVAGRLLKKGSSPQTVPTRNMNVYMNGWLPGSHMELREGNALTPTSRPPPPR